MCEHALSGVGGIGCSDGRGGGGDVGTCVTLSGSQSPFDVSHCASLGDPPPALREHTQTRTDDGYTVAWDVWTLSPPVANRSLTSPPPSVTQGHGGSSPTLVSCPKTWCLLRRGSSSTQPPRNMTALEMRIGSVVTLTKITVNHHFAVMCNNSVGRRCSCYAGCAFTVG